ncbi:NYN domain-containing protein [Rhodococcus sp. Q]|uniref:NYN domain-containing protein n=1 Tax=Rhodococcus sp. Q TaxID=2502252 RepID=UPI001BB1C997|nr:NYN domain-containing protein [Rhodococcus sp. Q]
MHVQHMRPTPATTPTSTTAADVAQPATAPALHLVTSTTTAAVRAAGGRHRCTRPRTLHLVDLENLLAGRVDAASVAEVWAEYQQVTGMRPGDHVVVAVAARHATATFFSLPGAVQRVVGADIPDGADLALLDTVDLAWTARRFGQVMIATGDHAFTGVAAHLHTQGVPVVQVIGGGWPSTGLYLQCSTQLYLTAAQRRVQDRRRSEIAAALAA